MIIHQNVLWDYENILNFNFQIAGGGGRLGILTVYVNVLKRSFINVKNNEVLLVLYTD